MQTFNKFFVILVLTIFFGGHQLTPKPKSPNSPALQLAVQNAGFRLPQRRMEAPDFRLSDLSGKEVRLTDFRHKIVLIHFWTTWCKPCIKELPRIEALYQRYKTKGLVVLAVNANRGEAEHVRKFAKKLNLSFPVLLDPTGSARKPYEIEAFPTSYLLGRDGRFLGKLVGESKWPKPPFALILSQQPFKGHP